MEQFWNRIPAWVDWIVAFVVAIVVFNLNITSAGDPLSGVGLSSDPTAPGLTEGGRTTFYAALLVGGVVLTAAGLVTADRPGRHGPLLARTFSLVTLAGLLGLMFDYRDGPVRMVQLVVYVLLLLGVVRLIRVVSTMTDGRPAPVWSAPDEATRSGAGERVVLAGDLSTDDGGDVPLRGLE